MRSCVCACVCLNGSLLLLLNYVKAELPGEPPPRTVVYLSLLPFLLWSKNPPTLAWQSFKRCRALDLPIPPPGRWSFPSPFVWRVGKRERENISSFLSSILTAPCKFKGQKGGKKREKKLNTVSKMESTNTWGLPSGFVVLAALESSLLIHSRNYSFHS